MPDPDSLFERRRPAVLRRPGRPVLRRGRPRPGAASDVPRRGPGPAQRRLALFLGQYWGGPTTYSDERGHPRLRMRHAPFPIDGAAHDAWLRHMGAAIDGAVDLDPADEAALRSYVAMAADHLRNVAG
ncbi:MAG: globin [Acidimicrobiales bacterium]